MALTKKEQQYLLKLARQTLEYYFETGKQIEIAPTDVPSKKLIETGACFVTLQIGHNLRGCIGTLEAHRPLIFDVVSNSLAAALEDPRFRPVRKDDLHKIKFSMSVLTTPVPFLVKNTDDLLNRLIPHKHGLIIQKGTARATFLPIVWEQLPEKEGFLSNLCAKAGLSPSAWQDTRNIEFHTYETEEFSESE